MFITIRILNTKSSSNWTLNKTWIVSTCYRHNNFYSIQNNTTKKDASDNDKTKYFVHDHIFFTAYSILTSTFDPVH